MEKIKKGKPNTEESRKVDKEMTDMTTEQVIKSLIIKSEEQGESKQIEDEFMDLYGDGSIIEPPYNPILWAGLMEKNSRLAKLIRTYARNTVGLGWEIKPIKTITKKTSKEEKEQIEKEKAVLEEFFSNCNNMFPLEEICFRSKVDEESMGNGYLEVSRTLKGLPSGLFHVPGHTIRVLGNRKGFVQIRNGKKVYFKIFNGDFDMNSNTGEIKTKGKIAYRDRANELIPFQIYTPRDSYYGIPRYVSTADAIVGNKLSARRNLSFFKNDATPRLAITVANGQLTAQSISDIKDFVNSEGKGVENAHRVMVLQAKAKQVGDMNVKDVKIDVTPLTVGQTDDASFIKYRNANDEEIREVFGIGEIFLGGKGAVNRATATILREITNEQEFIPDAKVKEFMINQTICRSLGVSKVKFCFIRPSSLGQEGKADIFSRYIGGGGITPNDIRHELGKPEYTEDWGDKPIQIGLVEYQMGLLGAQGAVSQGKNPDDETKSSKQKSYIKGKGADAIIGAIQKMINESLQQVVVELEVDEE